MKTVDLGMDVTRLDAELWAGDPWVSDVLLRRLGQNGQSLAWPSPPTLVFGNGTELDFALTEDSMQAIASGSLTAAQVDAIMAYGDPRFTLRDIPTDRIWGVGRWKAKYEAVGGGNGTGLIPTDGQSVIIISNTATVVGGPGGGLTAVQAGEIARDALGAALVAGSGITIVPDDAADTITISAPGAGFTQAQVEEYARDALGSALVAGAGITVTVNDAGDMITLEATTATLTDLDDLTDSATRLAMTAAERTKLSGVATGATANSTDAQLRDRSTHTGTQAISTITNLQAVLDAIPAGAAYNVKASGDLNRNAIGDGNDHPLSERFATLAAAQTVFPRAGSLNDQIDQCAIQRGLDLSTSVIIPPGVYRINSGVNHITGRTLLAYGVTFKPSVANMTATALFRHTDGASGQSNCYTFGLTVDCEGRLATGIRYTDGAANCKAWAVKAINATTFGFNFAASADIELTDCEASANGAGIPTDAGFNINANRPTLTRCRANNNLGNGFRILGAAGFRGKEHSYVSCRASGNTRHGFLGVANAILNAPQEVSFTDCLAETNGGTGTFSGFALHLLPDVSVTNCRAITNREHGFVLQDLKGASITGSTARANRVDGLRIQGDFSRAEDADTGVRNATITGCTFTGNGTAGAGNGAISLEGNCHDITITGNTIADSVNMAPVRLKSRASYTNCYNVRIDGNIFTGNGTAGPVNDAAATETRWSGVNLVDGVERHVNSVSASGPARMLSLPAVTLRVSEVGTWTDATSTAQPPFASRTSNGTGAVNDSLAWDVDLAAGTYKMALTYRADPAAGIVSLQLGGVEVTTWDMYEATGANRRVVKSGLTVVRDGIQRLSLVITGKNAGSSAHGALIGGVEMVRTGA